MKNAKNFLLITFIFFSFDLGAQTTGFPQITPLTGLEQLPTFAQPGGNGYVTTGDIAALAAAGNSDFTGWADYLDGVFTGVSPLALVTNTKITLPNNATGILDIQMPTDIDSMYSRTDTTIIGRNGDGLNVLIEFKVRPTSGADTRIFTAVDIGGAVGEIYQRDFVLNKGNGETHYFLSSFSGYTLNTWQTNGGKVKIESLGGPAEVWDIRYVLTRTHKAR